MKLFIKSMDLGIHFTYELIREALSQLLIMLIKKWFLVNTLA